MCVCMHVWVSYRGDSENSLNNGENQVKQTDTNNSVKQGAESGSAGKTRSSATSNIKTNLFIKVLLHHLINKLSNSLNDSISQTSNDHQYPGQSPLQSRQRLSKQQRPLDCSRTRSDHQQLTSFRLPSLPSYLTSLCIWYSETQRSTQLSPTFPGRWLHRSRTGFWAGLSNNIKTGPTRSQPSTRTRYTWPCRTVKDVSHCWWGGFRWTEQMLHHCVFLPSSEATLMPRCSREDPSYWSALKYKHMSPPQLDFTEPCAGVRVVCQTHAKASRVLWGW